ncbi:MAG: GTP-binding protein [Candidatus Helarchaeota archaeon]
MIFDYEKKIIQVKIVYYGPAMSGKTTSIKFLFSYFGKGDKLESIDSSVGRTLFFDFGVLLFKGTEWSLKFLLYTATGQDFYAGTRPATLNGVDGIIFVADSQVQYLEHNLRSWYELVNLFGQKIYEIPIIISFNKYDMEDKFKLRKDDFLNHININKFKYLSFNKTIATKGSGILESFKKVVEYIFPHLTLHTNIIN